jgi:hypothetical protein
MPQLISKEEDLGRRSVNCKSLGFLKDSKFPSLVDIACGGFGCGNETYISQG